jgi:hypothetical protein
LFGQIAILTFVPETINVYCDESCHLEKDNHDLMILGAVWCPLSKTTEIAERLRELKAQHHMPPRYELKWTSVSPSRFNYFRDVLNYFFDDDDLHFRVILAEKTGLQHASRNQTHDEWYYKMFFTCLKVLLSPDKRYKIYIDYKDTNGSERVKKLKNILSNNIYDYRREIVERVQLVRSHEVEMMQLADFLIGIVGYVNRGLTKNKTKTALVARMRDRSNLSLSKTTLLRADKVNVFRWVPQENEQ